MSEAPHATELIERSPPYHGEPVTLWRQQIVAMRQDLAEFILSHADPEEALRVAHDTALDLSGQVKRTLIESHGRTFDHLHDAHLSGII